jgi:hypothetical protein
MNKIIDRVREEIEDKIDLVKTLIGGGILLSYFGIMKIKDKIDSIEKDDLVGAFVVGALFLIYFVGSWIILM